MVGFDATGLLAPVTVRRDVLAATLASFPDDPPDGRGRSSRARVAGPARPRLIGLGQLLAGELVEKEGEGAVEHGVVVSGRHHVPEQVLRAPELLERLATDGELQLVAPRRKGRQRGGGWRRRRRWDNRRRPR